MTARKNLRKGEMRRVPSRRSEKRPGDIIHTICAYPDDAIVEDAVEQGVPLDVDLPRVVEASTMVAIILLSIECRVRLRMETIGMCMHLEPRRAQDPGLLRHRS